MSYNSQNDFDLVKSQGKGHWPGIIGSMYPDLAPIMSKPGQLRCACPIHGSSKGAAADGFRVFEDFVETGGAVCNSCGVFPTAIDLVMFLEGCDHKEAVKLLKHQMGLDGSQSVRRPRRIEAPAPSAKDNQADARRIAQRTELLARIWDESKPFSDLSDDHQAISYFRDTRGIRTPDFIRQQRHMRFHPNLYFARSDEKDQPPICFPGIVSMMHGGGGDAVGLHRIFLDHAAPMKAPVEYPKKILRCLKKKLNGAVRILGRAPITEHVNVCEGIETGMAISYATGHPVFAAGYGTLVQKWTAPAAVKFVTIWADRDSHSNAGIGYALKLRERLNEQGILSRILVPSFLETASEDWNDVLLANGHKAICDAYTQNSPYVQLH